jgi:RNA polymerase sigma factor FliA
MKARNEGSARKTRREPTAHRTQDDARKVSDQDGSEPSMGEPSMDEPGMGEPDKDKSAKGKSAMKHNTAQAYTHWQDGDLQNKQDRDRILLEQLPQVRYLARRIHERLPRHVPLEDLVHAGVIGLIDALNKFDRSKHVQFGSYAKFRIRGAILDSLREMDWGPRELRRKARKVEEAHRKLSLELSRAPTESEMAAELGMALKEFQHLLGELDSLEIGSLRIESPWDGKEEDLCDYLPNAPEDTPFFRCLRSEMKDLLAKLISELPEKEQQVLALYYFEELTMKEVGSVLGIGESRVSQIHSLAVVRLRTRLAEVMSSGGQARAATAAGD